MKTLLKLIFVLLLIGTVQAQTPSNDVDAKMEKMAQDLAKQLKALGKSRIGVTEFTDPQNYVTELGKYLADNFQGSLVHQQLRVINRQRLSQLLIEKKLTAQKLLDPDNSLEFGKAANMEVIIVGTVTAFSDREFAIEVLALDIQGAEAIASAKTKILRTPPLDKMHQTVVPPPGGGGTTVTPPLPLDPPGKDQVQDMKKEACTSTMYYLGQVCFENRRKEPLVLYKIEGGVTHYYPNMLVGVGTSNCGQILDLGYKNYKLETSSYTFYFHTTEEDENKRRYGQMIVDVESCKIKTRAITVDNLFLKKK